MAVKIRLTRLGKKKQPTYRVVVMDSRKARDGKYIEQLGFYDPLQDPSVIDIDNERAVHWLTIGAQPTERAQKLLEISGAWTQFKVAKGDIHTVGNDEPKPATKTKTKTVAAAAQTTPTDPAPGEAATPDATSAADEDVVMADAVATTDVAEDAS